VAYAASVRFARGAGSERELTARRLWHWLLLVEQGGFLAVLATGLVLMRAHGWHIGYPGWLSAKLGLVAFLLVPLECFQAYVAHGWLAPGLRESAAGDFSKTLVRAISMQDMLQALAVPLLGLGLPLVLWLSWARPF
jgi:hypothetical protein